MNNCVDMSSVQVLNAVQFAGTYNCASVNPQRPHQERAKPQTTLHPMHLAHKKGLRQMLSGDRTHQTMRAPRGKQPEHRPGNDEELQAHVVLVEAQELPLARWNR